MGAAFAGIPATGVFLRSGYELDNRRLGWVLAAMGLGLAVSELPWGLVTDRLGDRKVLLAGLGLTGAVLAWMAALVSPTAGTAPATALLGVGMFLVGAVGGSLNGSSGRAVMAWFQEGERGFAMSVRQTSLPVGGALGALVLPATAEHLGFRAVFGLLAAFCFVTATFTWAWLHEPPNAATAPHAARTPLRDRRIWRMVFGLGALCVPQVAVVTFAAVFLHDVGRLGTAGVSVCIVGFQLAAACARVLGGRFTDRRGNRRSYLKVCAVATSCLFAVLAFVVALGAVGAAVGVLIFGATAAMMWHGVAFTELATIAGMKHVATALGLGNTFAFGAYFLTPILVSFALDASGWPAVWLAASASALLASALFPSAGAKSVRCSAAAPGGAGGGC